MLAVTANALFAISILYIGIFQPDQSKVLSMRCVFVKKSWAKKMFIFNDSAFWFSHKDDSMIDEFVDLLKKKKLRINFMIYLKCTPFIGKKRLQKLKEVGLCRVFIGIENISNRFLDEYHKKFWIIMKFLWRFKN